MRKVEITGYGYYVPAETVEFGGQIRHRVPKGGSDTQLSMAVAAAKAALANSGLEITDIDCIVSASAVGVQPIPCTAALIHEQIAKGTDIPAMDINTTCTSFVSSFDYVSYLIDAGRYNKVLLVASELASVGLNPKQKESYELFGDGAAAVVLSKCESGTSGVIFGKQATWSEGAHDTEIRGGLTGLYPDKYAEDPAEYCFDMNGLKVLKLAGRKLPKFFDAFLEESGYTMDDIDMVVPHQASKALGMIMPLIGVPKDKYIDIVPQYGNMVSVAIPHALIWAIENGKIKKGDTVLLIGTAAGLTANALLFKY
ncbi:MAG: 3-oxoacyl-ACP synthase [Clostridiales bacterium]|nr:3-oxoacyl-ACP synthase [Clostridiales bacterium]